MTKRLGEIIKEARQARHLTLRGLTEQVTKGDGKPISPQYLFDIEEHHRVPAPHVLHEPVRVLGLDSNWLLAATGGAAMVIEEYLKAYPQQNAAVIKFVRGAQEFGNEDWLRLQRLLERGGFVEPSYRREHIISWVADVNHSDSCWRSTARQYCPCFVRERLPTHPIMKSSNCSIFIE